MASDGQRTSVTMEPSQLDLRRLLFAQHIQDVRPSTFNGMADMDNDGSEGTKPGAQIQMDWCLMQFGPQACVQGLGAAYWSAAAHTVEGCKIQSIDLCTHPEASSVQSWLCTPPWERG